MIRSAASKVVWVGRATVFLVGLAVILALVFGAATTAFGANGNPFLLGKKNAASALTKLTGNANGSAIQVVNSNAGADDTALSLSVQAGEAPMKVNSGTRVANLNADKIDGQDSSAFATDGELDNEANTRASTDNQLQQKDGRIAQSTTLLQSIAPSSQAPIAEVTITVPGSEKQMVYVDGSVTVFGSDATCPCNTSYIIRDKGTGQQSTYGFDQVDATTDGYGQINVGHSYAFVANPGTHTYEFRLSLSNAGDGHSLVEPVLTATTVPFGANGVAPAALSSFGASSASTTSEGNTPK